MKRLSFRRLAFLAVLLALVVPLSPLHAQSTICAGATCSSAEVGPFMAGITKACGNSGTCSLADIQTVFINVGNWILGIVGALVLLMYVVGGFYFLLSGAPGMEKYREKGKTAIKQSTVGLIVVFIAFAAITTLKNVLTGNGVTTGPAWVSCGPGNINSGLACGFNMQCTNDGLCVSLCEIQNPPQVYQTEVYWWACSDTTQPNNGANPEISSLGGCQANLCPGNADMQCCQFWYTY